VCLEPTGRLVGFRVATFEACAWSSSRGSEFTGPAFRSISVRGWWTSSIRLVALRGSRSRVGRAGYRVHRVSCPECFGARQVVRSADSSSQRDVERVSVLASGDTGEDSEGFVRCCGGPCGDRHAALGDSEHEAKGHERAAEVVHPIKASLWTQDREDRKRSWREYSTNTGTRSTGRALCSHSQRDERSRCRRSRR
jgi:hypothetical protein